MYRTGINAALLRVITSPPEWVKNLPLDDEGESLYFLPKYQGILESFLDATTDSARLVRASLASRSILAEYDLGELEDLRSTVQASELLRVISYARQTDHSAHTLYLYLLGIYLFFSSTKLRTGIASHLGEHDQSSGLLSRFLFQWLFASLLHDIGYVFQGRARSEIRAVDRLFRATTITRLMDSTDTGLKRAVTSLINSLRIEPFEAIQNPEDIVARLRHLPWGSKANFRDDTFESFLVYGPRNQQITGEALEDYAYLVAAGGYDGLSEGTVDHAIATGLFLFRYSTFWYYLAKETGFEDVFEAFQDGGYPEKDVVAGCFAAAAHNLIGRHARSYGSLLFEKNPIIYLGVLCDELQKWDRFPAGERYLVDLQSFDEYCTDSERITVLGGWEFDDTLLGDNKAEADHKLEGDDNVECDGKMEADDRMILEFTEAKLGNRINEALQRRLDSPDQFVVVRPTS